MSKRRSGGRRGSGSGKRRRQHLYLAFDDWSCGYSIRKIDLSADYDSDDDDGTEQRLPQAVFRLEAPRGMPAYFAAAFGTKIMAMHPMAPGIDGQLHVMPKHLVPVFDVRTRGVIFGPRPEEDPAHPIYVPVGDKLFALAAGSLGMLHPPPLDEPGGERWVWSWCQLPKPPFKREYVTSYLVHPDERTIFVSIERRTSAATFTFDTEADQFEWKRFGKWMLPFTGRAHFDYELDAWVGLSRYPDTIGHLCSCDVVSASSDGSEGQCPALKFSKENLFGEDPVERHVGATLVYMGGRSEFCLVQCISIDDSLAKRDEGILEKYHYCLRLTHFSLKYDKNGDLTTGNSRRVRYYSIPGTVTEALLNNPVAFWM